jgi:uncharacterized Zn-finger protein
METKIIFNDTVYTIYENIEEVLEFPNEPQTSCQLEFIENSTRILSNSEPQQFYFWSVIDGSLQKQQEELIIEDDGIDILQQIDTINHAYYSGEESRKFNYIEDLNTSFEKVMKNIQEEAISVEEIFLGAEERMVLNIIDVDLHVKKIICKFCDRSFNKRSNLTQHINYYHGTDRPFKCCKCSKTFVTEIALENHEEKHQSKNKPFKCEVEGCDRAYSTKFDLKRHINSNHKTGGKIHTCDCGKSFGRQDHLVKHKKTHMKKLLKSQKF